MRTYRAGQAVEDYCRQCHEDRMHTVIVVDGSFQPIRARCDFCGSEHNYRGGPRSQRQTGNREPAAGNRATGNRQPASGDRQPRTGSREPGSGSRQSTTGSREPANRNRQPAASNRMSSTGQ